MHKITCICLFFLALLAFELPIFFQQVRLHQFQCLQQQTYDSEWARATCLVSPAFMPIDPSELAGKSFVGVVSSQARHWTNRAFEVYLYTYSMFTWAPLMVTYQSIYWNDVPHAEICASLTKVSVAHWQDFPRECQQRIFTDLNHFLVLWHLCVLMPLFIYWLHYMMFYKSPDEHVREMLRLVLAQQRIVYTPSLDHERIKK